MSDSFCPIMIFCNSSELTSYFIFFGGGDTALLSTPQDRGTELSVCCLIVITLPVEPSRSRDDFKSFSAFEVSFTPPQNLSTHGISNPPCERSSEKRLPPVTQHVIDPLFEEI